VDGGVDQYVLHPPPHFALASPPPGPGRARRSASVSAPSGRFIMTIFLAAPRLTCAIVQAGITKGTEPVVVHRPTFPSPQNIAPSGAHRAPTYRPYAIDAAYSIGRKMYIVDGVQTLHIGLAPSALRSDGDDVPEHGISQPPVHQLCVTDLADDTWLLARVATPPVTASPSARLPLLYCPDVAQARVEARCGSGASSALRAPAPTSALRLATVSSVRPARLAAGLDTLRSVTLVSMLREWSAGSQRQRERTRSASIRLYLSL
jgi:hypothetical protein